VAGQQLFFWLKEWNLFNYSRISTSESIGSSLGVPYCRR